MRVLEKLEPERVFYYFEELAGIPHSSRDTKRISDYLYRFGKEHNLESYQDDMNNVILIKEATAGYENADPIIIQGHMDMVCEKESGCDIDFETEGLRLYVDGDFVKARQTTLGGDDGIAVAYALAILESDTLAHPRLEVIITVDEEIGMLGAFGIELPMIKGKKLLNIDSDVEGSFLTGCAGGMSLNGFIPVQRTEMSGINLEIRVTGLDGGHSGAEIHKEHGNAVILLGRVLNEISKKTVFGLHHLKGGLKDNAIPREACAGILVERDQIRTVEEICETLSAAFQKEFAVSDKNVTVLVEQKEEGTKAVLDATSAMKILFFLRETPNGVLHMSCNMENLVETSLNLGILELKDCELCTVTSIRSSVGTRKADLADRLTMLIEMLNGEVEIEGDYPAWEYRMESPLRDSIAEVYRQVTGQEPVFEAIHAGLECGIFTEKIPGIDCVSFGPNNYDIHTPKERLSVSSTKRVWDFLVEFLAQSK